MYRHRFVELFYFVLVISVLASSRLDAASLQLSWVDNSDNEDGFHIERKLGTNGIFSFVAAVGPNTTSYTDDNLASNTTYCYRLNAFNDIGISAYTNEACGTTSGGASAPPTPPVPSSNTVVTNISDGAVLSGSSVVWTATASGSPVRVEFFIDSALSWTENSPPFQFNGDPSGTLNTNTLSNGSHQLRVRAVYSNNSTAEQTITVTISNTSTPSPPPVSSPPPTSSTIAATLLGQTGEDIAGTTSETPDGIPDVHIRLSGVQGTISSVRITGGDLGGRWATPFNGTNWIVAVRPQSNLSLVDLYFDFYRPNSFYILDLIFADGSTQTVQTSAAAPTAPAPVSSTIAATLLGQTGEDIAGTTSEAPDGIPDVHIRLSGVQGTITRVMITDGDGGVWETPYNGWWIVAIRPHTDPSLVDIYFDFWQSSSSYTLDLTFTNGTSQTIQTSASLLLQMFGNSP